MIFYGLACILTFMLTAWANNDTKGRYSDALGAATLLCVSYGLTNLLASVYGLPDAILGFPVIDGVMTWMVWRAWRRDAGGWKVVLAALLVAQLAVHAGFIFSWYSGTATARGLYLYVVTVNGAFALQLLTVGSSGVRHALARYRHWLSDRRRMPARADV